MSQWICKAEQQSTKR